MKKSVLKYIKSIFTQFRDLSIPQIIFFVIGLVFWIIDLINELKYWPSNFQLIFDDFYYGLTYSYMLIFLPVTAILYVVQIFFKKINNTTITLNLLLNVPYLLINGMFFFFVGLGNI